ncbi:histidine ammonia-lyase [Bacillus sp. OxB-1]|nr:histidine ammonia-lyase [Bacillus sp. OxB-1]
MIVTWLGGSVLMLDENVVGWGAKDAYSLRCIPQVHGASWQALDYVKEKIGN